MADLPKWHTFAFIGSDQPKYTDKTNTNTNISTMQG